jgi:hypothetical protein
MRIALSISGLALAALALAQNPPSTESDSSVEVRLELRKDGDWQPAESTAVFHANDEIRFRFRTSFPGYLYVLNRGSTGETDWLYPLPDQGQTSRVEPGPVYLIPGTRGSFVVSGTPGFDLTYWVVSPSPIDTRSPAMPAPASQPSTLIPRCREQVLKARGLCVDERAGPRPLSKPDQVPPELRGGAQLAARDLKFRAEGGQTRISAKVSPTGVIVYEFRIAHR